MTSGNFQSLEVVDRGSETQLQATENLNLKALCSMAQFNCFSFPGRDDAIGEKIQDLCSENIQDVVDGYIHALLAWHPRARYLIGKDAKFVWMPFGYYLPEWIGDKVFELAAGRDRPIPAAVKNR